MLESSATCATSMLVVDHELRQEYEDEVYSNAQATLVVNIQISDYPETGESIDLKSRGWRETRPSLYRSTWSRSTGCNENVSLATAEFESSQLTVPPVLDNIEKHLPPSCLRHFPNVRCLKLDLVSFVGPMEYLIDNDIFQPSQHLQSNLAPPITDRQIIFSQELHIAHQLFSINAKVDSGFGLDFHTVSCITPDFEEIGRNYAEYKAYRAYESLRGGFDETSSQRPRKCLESLRIVLHG